GRGTRLKEETGAIPKPLVKIGTHPILWHIMKGYHAQGFRKFVLLVGYLGEKIKEYFYTYPVYHGSFTIRPGANGPRIDYHDVPPEDWEVTVLDTGIDVETGGRLQRAKSHLGQGRFLLTYGDGVADVNVEELIRFHDTHRPVVTITGVHPPSRFGALEMDGPLAKTFFEKPSTQSSYINGGFFVVEPSIFMFLSDDPKLNFEKDVLRKLARESNLAVYPHHGYWQCMDTIRDVEFLNEEWAKNQAPWKVWND
ncbi:MAG: sugar phosphate nucleotidyltransferase, partial [Patescibacteria group bacterium]